MRSFYAQFWPLHSSASLRRAIVVSIVLHVILVCALTLRVPRKLQLTQAGMYSIQLVDPSAPPAEAPPLGQPMASPPENPAPAPPPPPPKKDAPKKPEPPKKEPKKEVAKKEPAPAVKPKKEEVKPAKEEKPKKEKQADEKPKKEKKTEPKEEPVQIARNDNPLRDLADNPLADLNSSNQPPRPTRKERTPVPGVPTGKPGLTMAGGVPSVLGMWGGLVQRKVEKEWVVPQGIQLGPPDDGALISFWVNRDGQLVGEPEVVEEALDPAVATSAIRAIKAAVPYPALPDSFSDAQVQVYYTFIPVK